MSKSPRSKFYFSTRLFCRRNARHAPWKLSTTLRSPATLWMLAGALFLLASVSRSSAQSILFVTNTNDSGPGSLRQALADANPAGGSIIRFPGVTGTIRGGLAIDRPVIVEGPGADRLAITGRAFDVRVDVTNVVISGLSLIDGVGSSDLRGLGGGGGLRVLTNASVTVSDCVFTGNTTRSGNVGPLGEPDPWAPWHRSGGAVFNSGNLKLIRCTIVNNMSGESGGGPSIEPRAGGDGAGIYNTGQLYMEACNVSSNRCGQGGSGRGGACDGVNGPGGWGGGLYNVGRAVIVSSAFNRNSAGRGGDGCDGDNFYFVGGHGATGGSGGGIFSSGDLVISNCTLVGNSSGSGGFGARGGYRYTPTLERLGGVGGNGGNSGHGGAIHNRGSLQVVNTTIVGNTAVAGGRAGPAGPGTGGVVGATGTNGEGAGIYNDATTPGSLRSSFVAANDSVGSSRDVFGAFTSEGANLIENTSGSTGFDSGDTQGVDPDLDGLSNFMEFALGTDPRTVTVIGRPAASLQSVGGTEYATLTFTRATNDTAVRYEIKVADSLNTNSWQSGSVYHGNSVQQDQTAEVSRQLSGAVEIIVVRDLVPALSRSSRFLRLDVSIP